MNDPSQARRTAFRALIEAFFQKSLDAKRDKLPDDDPKYTALAAQYERSTRLAEATVKLQDIQLVTHPLKGTHPDIKIKQATNLYVNPTTLIQHQEVGSHCLASTGFADDVTGDAAALGHYKLLKQEFEGRTLLEWFRDGDPDAIAALNDDPEIAHAWAASFAALSKPRSKLSSHTLAKQLYWLSGGDPLDDTHYHLLAPLYASALAHRVFQTLNEDRFGDAAKAARQARRDNVEHPQGYAEYPSLAVQKLGGTKPQNISQLNSERGGNNYLLGSLPPQWKSRGILAPLSTDSVFPRFGRSPSVRKTVRELLSFLESDPPPTMETRNQRDAFIDALLDELVSFAAELQQALPQGWTLDEDCELVREEQLWLDPHRTEKDAVFRSDWEWMDWPAQIGKRFGNWLNNQLDKRLPLGEIEAREWVKELLLDEPPEDPKARRATWAGRLHTLRHDVDAPTYIPTREGT
ncbi:type I-F CRISPR-associated protein Csy1 [Uliginosibacterium sediminicola]|uniref:Type I-F CRISPR-associated protein Csy1 n=1 Tax=Uliginosibacterium sediminicola TaxID=2024550 RepID=A0ABU9Z0P6_9RHOO